MSRPAVTLKLATSLDGRIATASGESRWITSEAARAEVHRLRAAHDAVLVGIGTALADDPELTARTDPPPERQPRRIVMDRRLRLPVTARLVQTVGLGPVTLVTPEASPAHRAYGRGVDVLAAPPAPGETEAAAALRALSAAYALDRVFIEGGGVIAAAFLRAGLVGRLEWFRAPIVIGAEGRAGVGELDLSVLAAAPRFRRVAVTDLGGDLHETYVRD